MPETALLTVPEVAGRLGITTYRVYRRIQRGDLKASLSRQGNVQYLVAADELQRYIDAGGSAVLTPPQRVDNDDWMSTGSVAMLTGYSPEAIRKMCYQGQLKYSRGARGSHLRICRASVESLLG